MFNQVNLIGRVGKDPIFTEFDSNKCKLSIRIATWKAIKDETEETGWRQVTEWHNVSVWNEKANKAQGIQVGDMVHVVGELRYREYEDENKQKRIFAEIVGSIKRISTTPRKPKSEIPETTDLPIAVTDGQDEAAVGVIDDLPF